MPPSADPTGGAVIGPAMRRYGFERLLDLPALPAGSPDPLRYGHHAPARHGRGGWQLRGFGTEFDLLRPAWLRIGLTRGYSLGWGLGGDGRSSTVLLAQAVDAAGAGGLTRLGQELAATLADHGVAGGDWAVGVLHGLDCLRFAADLGGTPSAMYGTATDATVADRTATDATVADRTATDVAAADRETPDA